MGGEIGLLVLVFEHGFIGQVIRGPDLPVGMRIGAAHHRALVLEHLYPLVRLSETCRLFSPRVHHRTDLRGRQAAEAAAVIG